MRRFFYGRVSSKDQNPMRQILSAEDLRIDEAYIFIDKASGKDFQRPEYQLLKRMLREGDLVYITSLDRLGRNKQMILEEWHEITKVKKVDIIVLDMPLLDTTKYKNVNGLETLITDIVLQLLSYMAEDERDRIKKRQREGIDAAKSKGVKFGRKKILLPDEFEEIYNRWKNKEITANYAMEILDLKRNTFYRRVSEYENITK